MAKQVMQFRFYGEDDARNYPKNDKINIAISNLKSGAIFSDYYPIIKLGIQSLPGQQFYLNDANTSIVIGSTGIYELDLEGYAEITNLAFDINGLNLIDSNPNAYLIVDIISNKQGGNN